MKAVKVQRGQDTRRQNANIFGLIQISVKNMNQNTSSCVKVNHPLVNNSKYLACLTYRIPEKRSKVNFEAKITFDASRKKARTLMADNLLSRTKRSRYRTGV